MTKVQVESFMAKLKRYSCTIDDGYAAEQWSCSCSAVMKLDDEGEYIRVEDLLLKLDELEEV